MSPDITSETSLHESAAGLLAHAYRGNIVIPSAEAPGLLRFPQWPGYSSDRCLIRAYSGGTAREFHTIVYSPETIPALQTVTEKWCCRAWRQIVKIYIQCLQSLNLKNILTNRKNECKQKMVKMKHILEKNHAKHDSFCLIFVKPRKQFVFIFTINTSKFN